MSEFPHASPVRAREGIDEQYARVRETVLATPADIRATVGCLLASQLDAGILERVVPELQELARLRARLQPLRFGIEGDAILLRSGDEPPARHHCPLRGAVLAHRVIASSDTVSLDEAPDAARNALERFARKAEALGPLGRELAAAVRAIRVFAGPPRAWVPSSQRRGRVIAE